LKCEACGMEYGVSHNCPATASPEVRRILEEAIRAPVDGGIAYYVGEVRKILQWDDEAIRRNAKDPRATGYGLLFWALALLFMVLVPRYARSFGSLPDLSQLPIPYGVLAGTAYGVAGMVALSVLQVGLCFLIAKWFMNGTGMFVEVMRPLMLVWFVNCLVLLPRGILYAAGAWTAVLMMVFEEVMGITRMQAFCICAGINFCVFALQFELLPVTHHL
jgi:hypothetical protein